MSARAYTREQLEVLKSMLFLFAENARKDANHCAAEGDARDMDYFRGKRDAYEAAASHIVMLIESEEEVPA